jgi:hypothetical protein
MLKLKRKWMSDAGFVDPSRTFKDPVTKYEVWKYDVEKNLFTLLDKQVDKTLILFPYGLSEC